MDSLKIPALKGVHKMENRPISIQPVHPNDTQLPSNLPTDPNNPLSWFILLIAFTTAMEKPIKATASLIREIVYLLNAIAKNKR